MDSQVRLQGLGKRFHDGHWRRKDYASVVQDLTDWVMRLVVETQAQRLQFCSENHGEKARERKNSRFGNDAVVD